MNILCLSMLQIVSFPRHGDLQTPTGDEGSPDGLIKGFNLKSLHLDVTLANPTSVAYFNRGTSREEHVPIKDEE